MRFNISKLIRYLLIILLINTTYSREIKSSEKNENKECVEIDNAKIKDLNSRLADTRTYRKGDKLTFTLYNDLIDELLEATSENLSNKKLLFTSSTGVWRDKLGTLA